MHPFQKIKDPSIYGAPALLVNSIPLTELKKLNKKLFKLKSDNPLAWFLLKTGKSTPGVSTKTAN